MTAIFRTLRIIAALGLTALPALASAHHSTAFYTDEVSELEGELVNVEWHNPHTRFTLRVVNDMGEEEFWSMEGNSLYNLQRGGVTRDLFKIGDHVRVAGHKSTQRAFEFQVTNMLLPNGREALLWAGVEPRWRQDSIGAHDRLANALSPEKIRAENRGIFRVWSVPRDVLRDLNLPFTRAAIDARSSYNLLDNFATRCEQEGMPRIMINPHPFEFIDHGKEITLRTELYDIVRTIHMDRTAPPPDEPPSHLGYSVGAWQDGALVVTTTRVNWPYFDNIGTPQSENVRIVERYKLSADQTRLDYLVTVTDPATFMEPATMAGYWLALGDKMARYQCQAEW